MDAKKTIAIKLAKGAPKKTAGRLVVRNARTGRIIVSSGTYETMIKEGGISKKDIAKAAEYVKAARSYAP
jgi:hypothetical protein